MNAACEDWMKSNPGKTMTIYDIPAIIKEALPQTSTASNTQKCFECAGIFSFNRDIFRNYEFLPGYVTNISAGETETETEEQTLSTNPGSLEQMIEDRNTRLYSTIISSPVDIHKENGMAVQVKNHSPDQVGQLFLLAWPIL